MRQVELLPKEHRSCDFSQDRAYRYTLRITWDRNLRHMVCIGLNPSTADEFKDDPTLRRVKRFARDWGYGGVVMLNLFGFRATEPKDMLACPDPVGERGNYYTAAGSYFSNANDFWIYVESRRAAQVVCAWGTIGEHMDRAKYVFDLLPKPVYCLKLTRDGFPWHPLYVPANTRPQLYTL